MGLDLSAMKKKLDELNGVKRQETKNVMWKADVGEHRVRLLPWNDNENQPIKERHFYYLEGAPSILAPFQFGKPDPINELVKSLYKSGTPEDRNTAKKLLPKMRAYVPVIVRGEEDKGVQIWAFGKQVYQRILSFFVDSDIGDISDVETGYDLIVKVTKTAGKQFNDTTVDVGRRPTKLHADSKTVQSWTQAVPDLDEMFKLKPVDEIKQILDAWLTADDTPAEEVPAQQNVGTVKDNNPTATNKFVDLEAAFADLMTDEVKF